MHVSFRNPSAVCTSKKNKSNSMNTHGIVLYYKFCLTVKYSTYIVTVFVDNYVYMCIT